MSSGSQYLRAGDVADLLGMSIRTVRRWLADGSLPSIKIGGARLVLEEDLLMLLERPSAHNYNETRTQETSHQINKFSHFGKAQSK